MICHHDTKKTETKFEIELKGFNRYFMWQYTPKTLIDITIITMTSTPINNLHKFKCIQVQAPMQNNITETFINWEQS